MEQESINKHQRQSLIKQLLDFGFDQLYVLKAVDITLDKQKAAEILIKLVEEGPNADLKMYENIQPEKKQQGVISENINMSEVQHQMQVKPNRAKMIFIVNGALKMGKGKICAQVGHGVIGAYLAIEQLSRFDERSRVRLHSWQASGGAKIVVRANNLKQMLKAQEDLKKMDIGIVTHLVEDAGHTQIEAGSKTILAIGPAFSNEIDPVTDQFKLL